MELSYIAWSKVFTEYEVIWVAIWLSVHLLHRVSERTYDCEQ